MLLATRKHPVRARTLICSHLWGQQWSGRGGGLGGGWTCDSGLRPAPAVSRVGCREGSGQRVPPHTPPARQAVPTRRHTSRQELRAGLGGAHERGRQGSAAAASARLSSAEASPARATEMQPQLVPERLPQQQAPKPASCWPSPAETTVHAHEAGALETGFPGRRKRLPGV